MRILFVHQNFPGQYLHIVRALASQGGNQLVALGLSPKSQEWPSSLNYIQYKISRGNAPGVHPLASETEAKVIRGEACAQAAHQLKRQGFIPEIICAHPGWGESLFLNDIWPGVPILSYQEFYYHSSRLDTEFDLEFKGRQDWKALAKIRMKNAYLNLALDSSAWNITPTSFQRSTFPYNHQIRMSTIHDGVDTSLAAPLSKPVELTLADGPTVKAIACYVCESAP